MANPFVQYLRDTRGELRHVAWPTRTQTIVYATLVAGISVGIALYLGLFDFLFTSGLRTALSVVPQAPASQTQPLASTSPLQVTPVPQPSPQPQQAPAPSPSSPLNLPGFKQ